MKKLTRVLLVFGFAAATINAVADGFPAGPSAIVVDEFGIGSYNGAPLASGSAPDPYNGGALQLAYFLPFAWTYADSPVADILVYEPGSSQPSDLLRFMASPNAPNTWLFFYSDASAADPPDAPADVIGLPNPVFLFTLGDEVGLFGNPYSEAGPNGFEIQVNGPRPGWDFNPNGTRYTFISDIPEPGSLTLVGLGAVGLLAIVRRKK